MCQKYGCELNEKPIFRFFFNEIEQKIINDSILNSKLGIGIDFKKLEFFWFFRNRVQLINFRKITFNSKFLRYFFFQLEKKFHFRIQNFTFEFKI